MKASERFQSDFFRADPDLKINGQWQELTLTITEVGETQYKDSEKKNALLSFKEHPKKLGLNATNWHSIVLYSGIDDDADWVGVKVTLFMAIDNNKAGQPVPCVRVKSAVAPGVVTGATHSQSPPIGVYDSPLMQSVTTLIDKVEGIDRDDRPFWIVHASGQKYGTYVEAQGTMAATCIIDHTEVVIDFSLSGVNKMIISINPSNANIVAADEDVPF